MLRFLLRRLVLLVVTLFVSSLIIFVVLNHNPRGVAVSILGQFATEDDIQTVMAQLGLDRPALERYWELDVGVRDGETGASPTRCGCRSAI